MNNVNITGRIANDIQLNLTKSGNSVCFFAVAVDRPGVKDKVDFIDCAAWGQTAGFIAKHFAKGDGIEITGSLTSRVYEDKDGIKRKQMQVNCGIIGFPKGRKKRDASAEDETHNDANTGEDTTPSYIPAAPTFSEADIKDNGELPF